MSKARLRFLIICAGITIFCWGAISGMVILNMALRGQL